MAVAGAGELTGGYAMSDNPAAAHRPMTVAEVAAQLRTSPYTVYRLLRAGVIPSYRVGRGWRIDAADVEAFIARQKEESRGR